MSEPTPDASAPEPESTVDPPAAEQADDDAPFDMAAARRLRHENAGLRARLKESESARTEVEGMAARLADLERREVERIAAQDLIDPSDLWSARPDMQSFYDDEFHQLVPDKVREAAQALIAQKPYLAKDTTPQPPPTNQPVEGLRPGASPELKRTEITWNSALRRSGI